MRQDLDGPGMQRQPLVLVPLRGAHPKQASRQVQVPPLKPTQFRPPQPRQQRHLDHPPEIRVASFTEAIQLAILEESPALVVLAQQRVAWDGLVPGHLVALGEIEETTQHGQAAVDAGGLEGGPVAVRVFAFARIHARMSPG